MSIIERAYEKLKDENSKELSENSIHTPKEKDRSLIEEKFDIESNEHNIAKPPDDNNKLNKSNTFDIDFEKLDTMDFLTPMSDNLKLAEQFRHIKMRLLSITYDGKEQAFKNSNIIMVTSSLEGEGKTFISLNLALSLAYEYNRTVLYIDADTIKKSASILLNLGKKRGLTEYLSEDSFLLSEFLVKSNIPKFSFLPAGRTKANVTELFASNKMESLIDELSTRYDDRLIIIDSPPLLQESSTYALTKMVGQVILTVEAEKTPQHIVEKALDMMHERTVVSLVHNKSNQKSGSGDYYGYGTS